MGAAANAARLGSAVLSHIIGLILSLSESPQMGVGGPAAPGPEADSRLSGGWCDAPAPELPGVVETTMDVAEVFIPY
jgi:hypothetical protein